MLRQNGKMWQSETDRDFHSNRNSDFCSNVASKAYLPGTNFEPVSERDLLITRVDPISVRNIPIPFITFMVEYLFKAAAFNKT